MSTDPLFMKVGSEYYWYQNDHLKTPQMMTTSSGAVVWKATYTSFGKAAIDPISTVVNPLRFSGQYEDAETGLYYNRLRYFDPHSGRYISMDFMGLFGGLNLFVYVQNNPASIIDPLSLDGYYPDALTFGGSATIGILFGLTGGFEFVINTESGEVSLFLNGGFEAGLTSFGVNAKSGSIWNLDKNCNYEGPFLSGNASAVPMGIVGVSAFASSDKLMSSKIVPGPYGVAGTAGVNLIPATLSVNSTVYKKIFTIPLLGYILNPAGAIFNAIDKGPTPIPSLGK
jgi:RHS repeat-associated protein